MTVRDLSQTLGIPAPKIIMFMMGLGKAAEAMGKYITTQQTARQAYLQLDQQRKQGSTLDSTKATAVAFLHPATRVEGPLRVE